MVTAMWMQSPVPLFTKAASRAGAAWFEYDSKGRFETHVIAAGQASYDTRPVDIDGDEDLDVLIAGQESGNAVWFENRLKR